MDRKCPPEVRLMHSAAYVETARGWERRLVDGEARRAGVDHDTARAIVARRTEVPKGTLLSLRKNRLKGIAVHWYERLRSGVIRELEAELRHLEHELAILRQTGTDPRSDATAAVVADIAKVRAALGLTDTPPAEGGG
jgi:hypothetical protein